MHVCVHTCVPECAGVSVSACVHVDYVDCRVGEWMTCLCGGLYMAHAHTQA